MLPCCENQKPNSKPPILIKDICSEKRIPNPKEQRNQKNNNEDKRIKFFCQKLIKLF